MTTKKERLRRRRRMVRAIRRTFKTLLLIPGKIPPIDIRTVEACMKLCETFGVLFVITMIARLSTGDVTPANSTSVISVLMTISGIVFFGLLSFIKLADYQDRLVRMDMADYFYIR